jgi:hypothetical protein
MGFDSGLENVSLAMLADHIIRTIFQRPPSRKGLSRIVVQRIDDGTR